MTRNEVIIGLRGNAAPALVLLAALLAVVAYVPTIGFPFVSDDTMYILTNTKLQNLPAGELLRLFGEPFNVLREYLPLREFSFWLDLKLFGPDPAAFRIHNLLLHLASLPLMYATTLMLLRQFNQGDGESADTRWTAAGITALFALHPALVESVVWISGRKYVLPNFLSLLAFWFALRAPRDDGISPGPAFASLLAFAAVMLAKASYFAVAPAIALIWVMHWIDLPRPRRRLLPLIWPVAILALAALLTGVFYSIARGDAGEAYQFGLEAITRPLAALGWLTRLALTPEPRHLFYPFADDPAFPFMLALGGLTLAAVVFGAWRFVRRRSLPGLALLVYFLFCLPYLHILPFTSPSIVQDRYLSIALWPLLLAGAVLAMRLKPTHRAALLLVFAVPWTVQVFGRARDWSSFEKLVDIDLRAFPGHFIPAAYTIKTSQIPERRYQEAVDTARAIRDPEVRELMFALTRAADAVDRAGSGDPKEASAALWAVGNMLRQTSEKGRRDSPIQLVRLQTRDMLIDYWQLLAQRFPRDFTVRYNAGLWLLGFNLYAQAEGHLAAALASPDLPQSVRATAYKNLGLALFKLDRLAEAEARLGQALTQTPPDLRAHCWLADLHRKSGQHAAAAVSESVCRKIAGANANAT